MLFSQVLLVLSVFFLGVCIIDFLCIARNRTKKAPIIIAAEYGFLVSSIAYFFLEENFEYVLTVATVFSGFVYLVDKILLIRLRRYRYARIKEKRPVLQPQEEEYLSSGVPVIVDYSRSFFWVLLLVFVLRSFLFEPFRIPTGSLVPTLLPGDFILVNKFDYGLRLPVLNQKIWQGHEPQRGDIVVFRYPVNPKVDFIKRVVGIPGDTISYVDKVFYINGQKAEQTYIRTEPYLHEDGSTINADRLEEDLLGKKHHIYQFPSRQVENFTNLVVPENMYFMIGDNRDDSTDSRYWGFVPESYIVGKPIYVLFNWDSEDHRFRWQRTGLPVQVVLTQDRESE